MSIRVISGVIKIWVEEFKLHCFSQDPKNKILQIEDKAIQFHELVCISCFSFGA
jgi:hypothetical protein